MASRPFPSRPEGRECSSIETETELVPGCIGSLRQRNVAAPSFLIGLFVVLHFFEESVAGTFQFASAHLKYGLLHTMVVAGKR